MKISIVLATYNGAEFLNEQLKSFLNQSQKPNELIISDDNSTDETIEIINKFIAIAPFKVTLFQNETRIGYTANFNKALMNCTGDLVFLSDQDDVWFPNKIKDIANIATHSDNLLFINDTIITDSSLNHNNISKIQQIKSAGLPVAKYVMGACTAVKRELLDICLPIPKGFKGHDVWLVKLSQLMGTSEIIHTPLQYYRRHGKNESTWVINNHQKLSRIDFIIYKLKKHSFSLNKVKLEMSKDRMMHSLFYNKIREQIETRSKENPNWQKLKTAESFLEPFIKQIEARNLPLPRRFISLSILIPSHVYSGFPGIIKFIFDLLKL